MSIVYLNGSYLERDKASVSVMDRGFLLGDGVYEVIPAYAARLFRLEAHLARLQGSLDAVGIPNPHSGAQWQDILDTVVARNGGGDLSVYLQVTRGAATHRDHAFPPNVVPTVFVMANPIVPLDSAFYENGVAAITLEDNRWQHCDIKAISLLPNVLLRQRAIAQGMAEAILLRQGQVTEGAASNVFVVSAGVIKTPPNSPYILTGVTRDLVLELALAHGLSAVEAPISEQELLGASEIWLTSSTKEVLPVTRLNDTAVGTGKPGDIWRKMTQYYREYKKELARRT